MYKNYKKLLTLFTLALQPLMSTAAVNSSGASVWFDTGAVSALSPAQIEAVNADTLTFWNNGEPNDSGGTRCTEHWRLQPQGERRDRCGRTHTRSHLETVGA